MFIAMAEIVPVEVVVTERTHIGKVNFPVSVPENLLGWLQFPADLVEQGPGMGLSSRDVRFILGALRGKWGLNAVIDLPDLALKLGMTYDEMDKIVRDLIEKGYGQLTDKLNLYRLWIVVLHQKGIRFNISEQE
jgi:hypothetical protein